MVLAAGVASAANSTSDHEPVELTSSGETTYENGVATARDNVAIHIGDTDIYGDFAQYNSRTHEDSVEGHVRIYRRSSLLGRSCRSRPLGCRLSSAQTAGSGLGRRRCSPRTPS